MTKIPEELMAQYNNAEPIIMSLEQIQSEIFQACQQIVSQSDGFYSLCSKQPKCSRILEEALQFLYQEGSQHSTMLIKGVFYELADSMSELSEDNNGSHVVQTLLILISRLCRQDQSLDKAYDQFLSTFLQLENGKQLIQSPHSVQILKTLLLSEHGLTDISQNNATKNKHQISNVIGGMIYGNSDKFFNKTSSHYPFIYKSIYNIITNIGIIQLTKVPDTSSLLQLMIGTNSNGWTDEAHSWLVFLYELIGCTDRQNQNKILKCIQQLIEKKALIWDTNFNGDQIIKEFNQEKYMLIEEVTEACLVIKSCIKDNVYTFLDQYNQSQIFLLEKLLEQKQLQVVCFCMLEKMTINDILNNSSDKNYKYMHLLIKCINNAFFCPQILLKLLYDVYNNLELIFESQKDCYAISAVINSVNRILLRVGHQDLEQISQGVNEKIKNMLEQLIEKISLCVESGSFLVKKLLLPNVGIHDPIDLSTNSFSRNQKYEIQYLDIQVDKTKVGENEFKQLMTKKREEHEKIKNVKLELKYGNQRFKQYGDKDKTSLVYGPGKDIIIKCIESSNDYIRNVFLTSFQASFLEQQDSVVSNTIFQLIDCPATNDLILTIINSSKTSLGIKLKILSSQKTKYNDLCKFKLGRLFIQALVKPLFTQVILNDQQYDVSVNMSGICMIVEEVAAKLQTIQLLKQSDEGQQIIISFDLEKWLQDQDAWIKKTWSKLCKLGKQNNLLCDENGFQKFNYLVVKQIHYHERKQQHKQRQQQINNSKKYYNLRQKAKMQDIK